MSQTEYHSYPYRIERDFQRRRVRIVTDIPNRSVREITVIAVAQVEMLIANLRRAEAYILEDLDCTGFATFEGDGYEVEAHCENREIHVVVMSRAFHTSAHNALGLAQLETFIMALRQAGAEIFAREPMPPAGPFPRLVR